jgi:hypothetical protein
MGCDYYIYTVLKIVHNNGVQCIKLSEEKKYLYGYESDNDDFTVHPLNRKPKIDYMKPTYEDVLIYTKGEPTKDKYIEKYMILIEELIKENLDIHYTSTNTIIRNNVLFSEKNPDSGKCLENKDNIHEMYIIELRGWRP